MTEWTWKTLDFSKAKAGDIIVDDGRVEYIKDIRPIGGDKNGRAIQPETRITLGGYTHLFHWDNEPGAGYSFDCFADGSLPKRTFFTGQSEQEYFDEIKATPGLIYDGIRYGERSFNQHALIKCVCGETLYLEMVMTNTCESCNRDYNSSGQLLAPRNQWGWDTGETVGDILSSDWGINDPGPGHEGYDSLGED